MSRRIRALHDYAPTGEGQIPLKASVTYELLDDSGPWWTVRSDIGQQGIVPSNYVEMIAAGPPIPALPQAPPGYAPQADAKSAYPPQQMGMPQQQMGMVPQQQMGMVPQQQMGMMPQQQMAQQTTVVQVGAASPAVFVNPGGATCHTIWGWINICCTGGWPCGIAALISACTAAAATNEQQYQSAIASARCCNIAGSAIGAFLIILIIILACTVWAGAASIATSSYSCTYNGFAC